MERKTEETRQLLFDSAIEAFARKGYAGTSVTDILKATGLSKPTLYYYFQSKAGLFNAILDFAIDEPYRLMQEAVVGLATTQEKLAALAAVLFQFCGTHQHVTRLALATVFAAPEEVPSDSLNPAKRRRNFEFFLNMIREGQKRRELDSELDSTELAHGIFGSISHQIRTHITSPTGRLDDKRAERVVALFLNGARPRK